MDNQSETTWRILDTAFSVIGALVMTIWGMLHMQLSKDNRALHARIKETNSKLERHEEVFDKIFDRMEKTALRSEERHLELLNTFHNGLNSKQDKL